MTLEKVDCTADYLQGHLNFLNVYFGANPDTKNMWLIIGGLLSDIIVAVVLLQWVANSKTWRFPIALVCLYLTRLLCSVTFMIRYPKDYIWGYPGFPSITVPYGMANDFHFAVHVGLIVVSANELWDV
jgi:hypothetical protein